MASHLLRRAGYVPQHGAGCRRSTLIPMLLLNLVGTRPSYSARIGGHSFSLSRRRVSSTPASTSFEDGAQRKQTEMGAHGAAAGGPTGCGELGVYRPIDFDRASRVEGYESQILIVDLEPGQVLRTQSGSVLYLTDGVEFSATTGGGFGVGFRRMMSGARMFVTDFRYTGAAGGKGTVALRTETPCKMIRVKLPEYGGSLICRRGSFVAGSHDLTIDMEFTQTFRAGFFGGHGFILQKILGRGDAFIRGGGTVVRRELSDGESLRVTSSSVVAFSPSVTYDVSRVRGAKNIMFGGEGWFMTILKGPGVVFLQSMPFDRLAEQFASRVSVGGGSSSSSARDERTERGREDEDRSTRGKY